jgi:hypothetical protein
MAKSSLSWIDRGSVSALLGRVRGPAAPPSVAFLGAPSPAPIRAPAPAAPAVVAPPAPPAEVPAPPAPALSLDTLDLQRNAGAKLEERLERYLRWITGAFPGSAAFVADESGLALVTSDDDDSLVAITAPCMGVFDEAWSVRGGPRQGRLALAIDGLGLLHVAEVSTPWGRFAIAVVAPAYIDDATMRIMQQGLDEALNEEAAAP